MDLARETADVLARLIRFDTVNPPGNERAAQEWLRDYLTGAGLEVELAGAEPERPNLVARLPGREPGPALGLLSHMDTVLANRDDWSRDPWGGEEHDGCLWGRGALDMKGQTAAEAVAAAALARSGWRPARGELRVICVVDEETGGELGAKWLTEERPDLARVDWLVNEGGGAAMPHAGRRFYGVCCAEKGTFRFAIRAHGVAGHASVPAVGDNALVKLAPVVGRLAAARFPYDPASEPEAFLRAVTGEPDAERGIAALREHSPVLAIMAESAMQVTVAPTRISASEKINVIPARAELQVDCRVPPGLDGDHALSRVREAIADDTLEVEALEQVIGNRSPIESDLMEAIGDWVAEADPGGAAVPIVLPAFTDSRWFRHAFPDCVAYGFFPQRHQTLFDTWPLMHGADERIDVRDLGWATEFFTWLPRRLLDG